LRDDNEGLFDEVRVLLVLSFSPSFERAFQDVVNICGSLLASPHSSDEAVNRATPSRKRILRP